MNKSVLNLLCPALVPILATNVAAGTACHIHFMLVTVSTVRTLPDQLYSIIDNLDFPIVTTTLTVVTLGIEFCIQNIVVDILQNLKNRLNIVVKIACFDIADSPTRRQYLKL